MSIVYVYNRRRSNKVHAQSMKALRSKLEIHERQVQKRCSYLRLYKFLIYNLDESLYVQKEIELPLK